MPKPFLRPAMQKILDDMASNSILPRSMIAPRGSGKTSAAAFARAYMGTFATGGSIPMPDPPPYGTVLRPGSSSGRSRYHRLMVVGPLPHDSQGAGTFLIRIDNPDEPPEAWISRALMDEWEEVPD